MKSFRILPRFAAAAAILVALMLENGMPVSAEPDCGEWTVCGAPTLGVPPTPTPRASANDQWGLPPCTPENERTCKNKCHGSFGPEFWTCVQGCLAGICAGSGGRSGTDVWNAPDDAAGCVELASSECAEDCASREGSAGTRCRSDCLSKRCPESNRADIAREGGQPGALTCDRCISRSRPECARACYAGAGAYSGINGLGGILCERSCLTVKCGGGCSLGF